MTLFRFYFWRLYRTPKAGEWWEYCDDGHANPFSTGRHYLIVETRGNWALIRYHGAGEPRSAHFSELVAFYRPAPPASDSAAQP